ncbi:hypothetical protein [Synechococcus sp. CBW1006]|uniref:hypothetical protein n=1 Tax=Synechococcus sp. CBW1006 TaxID=1353138 RepID=UPI0018CF9F05|nr:hypothetical protein [Synechococcus sp. CBW1006]QPN66537.1 hypothetical protein H8F26_17740 [Synechococcus sp. CBW1006]
MPGDLQRPTFNGQLVIDGNLNADTITGSSYRNWMIGGGIFASSQERKTKAVDVLTGTQGALDVFDLRTSDFSGDAYSGVNTGSAQINHYTQGEDFIVLSGLQGSYDIVAQTKTSGRGWRRQTITTGYQIFSSKQLVATIAPAAGTTFTGSADTDLSVLYGQSGDPTETLLNGQ